MKSKIYFCLRSFTMNRAMGKPRVKRICRQQIKRPINDLRFLSINMQCI